MIRLSSDADKAELDKVTLSEEIKRKYRQRASLSLTDRLRMTWRGQTDVGKVLGIGLDIAETFAPKWVSRIRTEFQYKQETNMKPFHKTALGRTLSGKNKTGRIIHSVIDVLPIPNVHEVVKAVIKDAEAQNKVIGVTDILKKTFQRLDYLRTAAGIGLIGLYVFDVITLSKAQKAFELIISLF